MRPIQNNTLTLHNGPVCATCGRGYIGAHQCDPAELRRQALALLRQADAIDARNQSTPVRPHAPFDRTAGCPCRPENGGSGICGCILGGVQITCATG